MDNRRKHNSEKQPMVDNTLEPIQHFGETQCREGHSTFEPGPAGNTLQIGMFYTLMLLKFSTNEYALESWLPMPKTLAGSHPERNEG